MMSVNLSEEREQKESAANREECANRGDCLSSKNQSDEKKVQHTKSSVVLEVGPGLVLELNLNWLNFEIVEEDQSRLSQQHNNR